MNSLNDNGIKKEHEVAENVDTVKPLNIGHLRVLKNLSVTDRCRLLRSNLKTIFTFGTCPLFGMSAIGRFHCIITGRSSSDNLLFEYQSSLEPVGTRFV